MSLEELIKNRIRAQGAITVADYMELALSHPEYGYYMQRDPLGVAGDFITSPEISQVFGEVIGGWLAHNWQLLGAPAEVALVELGAGRGTLMADALRATKNVKGFHDALSVHLVEISPILRQKQWKTLAGKHERLEWHEDIDDLPPLPMLLVANEFFDALPIRQFFPHPHPLPEGEGEKMVSLPKGEGEKESSLPQGEGENKEPSPFGRGQGEGLLERMVALDENDDLSFIPPLSQNEENSIRETCVPGLSLIEKISTHIGAYGGAALIIDYGYSGGSKGDTLQAIKDHAYHPVLKDAGDADLTAHVDFSALMNKAKACNVNVYGVVAQGQFLMRLGAGARTTALCETATQQQQERLVSGLKRLADPQEMGELFKVMAITSKNITQAEGF